MTPSFLVDEHVPSVFVTSLRSNGYPVRKATEEFGEGTIDRELLEYCAKSDHILITNDKKDFTRGFSDTLDHAGIIIYTDPVFLRDSPEDAVVLIDRILETVSLEEIAGERI